MLRSGENVMDRRKFMGIAAGTVLGGAASSSLSQDATRGTPLEFTNPRAGAGPFERTRAGKSPHIFLISADMVSPDLRSEEHTSELQSHLNLVCRLLLEKKKEKRNRPKAARSAA